MSPGPQLPAEASWAAVLARARSARIVLVLGESDTGKTTLVTALAAGLLDAGSVGVVDADLGQSEIGPPTTIGLGWLRRRVECLAAAELAGLYFVGALSPRDHLLPTVLGTRRMTERAFALGVDRVIVDTSGLVHGELGRQLKQAKIDLVAPDLIVCLQRDGECGPILRPYAEGRAPRILRLGAARAARRRSPEQRRQHRERAMRAYFSGARPVTLDLGQVVLRTPALYAGTPLSLHETEAVAALLDDAVLWAERQGRELVVVTPGRLRAAQRETVAARYPEAIVVDQSLDDFQDMLAGLEDPDRETVGLGIVRAVDFHKRVMVVETPVPERAIAGVRLGGVRL